MQCNVKKCFLPSGCGRINRHISMENVLAHLAVAVENLGQAAELYRALGFEIGNSEIVESEKVRLTKAMRPGVCVELLEAYPHGEGPIARFLTRHGAGLHHVA